MKNYLFLILALTPTAFVAAAQLEPLGDIVEGLPSATAPVPASTSHATAAPAPVTEVEAEPTPQSKLWDVSCKDQSLPEWQRPAAGKKKDVIYGDVSMRLRGQVRVTGKSAVLEDAVVDIVGPFSSDLITRRKLPPIHGKIINVDGYNQFVADMTEQESPEFSQITIDSSGSLHPSWITDRKSKGRIGYYADCSVTRALN